jgi:hypothetical protein
MARWLGDVNQKLTQQISVDGYSRNLKSGFGLVANYVDFGKGESVSLPFRYFDKYIPREEIPEEEILPFLRGEIIKLKMPFTYNNSTYPQGLRGEIKRVDYVFKTAYVYFYGDDSGNYPVPFEYLEKFVDTYETPKEVNLDEYINDLNVLLEMEDDESKRLELATYISDLNILKLLD